MALLDCATRAFSAAPTQGHLPRGLQADAPLLGTDAPASGACAHRISSLLGGGSHRISFIGALDHVLTKRGSKGRMRRRGHDELIIFSAQALGMSGVELAALGMRWR